MIEQLASLLLPIDALLSHADFIPQKTTAAVFRNMWFLCVLFHFTSAEDDKDKAGSAMEWQGPALRRISIKTPSMVKEEAADSVASDLEYNSVIRQEYVSTVRILIFDRKCMFLKRHSM
jgi:phosphatidylinositol 4-kinase